MRYGRHKAGLWAALVLTSVALAVNPKPAADRKYNMRVERAAVNYANDISRFVNFVHLNYERRLRTTGPPKLPAPLPGVDVATEPDERRIPKPHLYEAAIQGLYEAARHPVPANLREMFEKAKSLNDLRKGRTDLGDQEKDESQDVLQKLRADLGDHEAVVDQLGLKASAAGIARILDPYCGLIGAKDFLARFDYAYVNQQPFGVGIEFANAPTPGFEPNVIQINNGLMLQPLTQEFELPAGLPGQLVVKTIIPGSPAQLAGLRPGDRIVAINGKPCRDCPPAEYLQTFFADATSTIHPRNLGVERPATGKLFTTALAPKYFIPETVFGAHRMEEGEWSYMLDPVNHIGYVRIGPISVMTSKSLIAAVRTLQGRAVRGMILDLRWCPGGYLRQAIEVAKCFLPVEANVFAAQTTAPEDPEELIEPMLNVPLLVLVNGATSGGGELIAAALQDHQRGIIAGERTFGKASIQKTMSENPLPSIQFKLTTGTFYRPSGKNLHRFPDSTPADDWGVRPDPGRWLPLSPTTGQLLKEWWTWHALRPAGSREILPTDDPEIDPQLKAAVQMLKQKLQPKQS